MPSKAQKKSWVAVANKGKEMVYIVRFTHKEDGEKLYYAIAVDGPKEPEFLKALESGLEINLADYGQILASDTGEPSEEVKAWLRENYNATV